ncbi:SIS domain-containing protein [Granulosicoccaceae sp. 1_MG-2023]|nr:SIS domain-containing protein [Granulosicoccaceae sp. 1_MG-2023]
MSDEHSPAGLYPFLSAKAEDERVSDAALLNSVQQKAAESLAVKKAFFDANGQQLVDAARLLADSYAAGGRLFTMGNGGSACDAAHLAVEFQHPVTTGRPALAAMNLGNDMAMFSAVANDVGVKHVFTRQLLAHARKGDVLVGFSTSGNSGNLLAAFTAARGAGLACIGFAGHDGGEMQASGLLDCCLTVPTDSIHRVQETHLTCYHILWDLVHTLLADSRGKTGTQR